MATTNERPTAHHHTQAARNLGSGQLRASFNTSGQQGGAERIALLAVASHALVEYASGGTLHENNGTQALLESWAERTGKDVPAGTDAKAAALNDQLAFEQDPLINATYNQERQRTEEDLNKVRSGDPAVLAGRRAPIGGAAKTESIQEKKKKEDEFYEYLRQVARIDELLAQIEKNLAEFDKILGRIRIERARIHDQLLENENRINDLLDVNEKLAEYFDGEKIKRNKNGVPDDPDILIILINYGLTKEEIAAMSDQELKDIAKEIMADNQEELGSLRDEQIALGKKDDLLHNKSEKIEHDKRIFEGNKKRIEAMEDGEEKEKALKQLEESISNDVIEKHKDLENYESILLERNSAANESIDDKKTNRKESLSAIFDQISQNVQTTNIPTEDNGQALLKNSTEPINFTK